jgi:hypothetical protein
MRRLSCGRPTTWTTGSVSPSLLPFNLLRMCSQAVEGQLPGQLKVCLSLTSSIYLLRMCSQAMEGQLPGQLEVCLSLTSYI